MNIHVYTFENLDGKRTVVKTSHELKPVFLEAMMDSFGNSFRLEVQELEPVCTLPPQQINAINQHRGISEQAIGSAVLLLKQAEYVRALQELELAVSALDQLEKGEG